MFVGMLVLTFFFAAGRSEFKKRHSKNRHLNNKEWTGKTIYFNFSSIFGDFFFEIFEEEVSDYLS